MIDNLKFKARHFESTLENNCHGTSPEDPAETTPAKAKFHWGPFGGHHSGRDSCPPTTCAVAFRSLRKA